MIACPPYCKYSPFGTRRSIRSSVRRKLGLIAKKTYNSRGVKGFWVAVGIAWTFLCLGMELAIRRNEALQLETAPSHDAMSRIAKQGSAEISTWAYAHIGGVVLIVFLAALALLKGRKVETAAASTEP